MSSENRLISEVEQLRESFIKSSEKVLYDIKLRVKRENLKDIEIEATKSTPLISLKTNGKIDIIGKSYPENTFEFYQPLIKWIDEYFQSEPEQKTEINIDISYFNSSSSKLFFDFFDILDINSKKFQIEINWLYDKDNETALEMGEDFKDDFDNLNINIISKP